MRDIFKAFKIILTAGIIITFSLQGNAQVLQQVDNAFNRAQQNVVQEKIFTHTDKETYLAGELIWFKLYCIDAATHKPIDISKVAYVEVLDKEHTPVLQAKIALKNGSGSR